MQPFKIKSSIELDSREATEKLQKFKNIAKEMKTIDIQLNIKNLDSTFKQINDIYQKMSKMNQSFVNEQIKLDTFKQKERIKIESARQKERMKLESKRQKEQMKLEYANLKEQQKLQKKALKESIKPRNDDEQSLLIAKYKDTYNTISKLQQQLSKGVGNGSFNSITSEITKLENNLNSLYNKIDSKGKLELFEFKQGNSATVKLEKSLAKIETKAEGLKKSLNSIDFKNVNTGRLSNDLNNVISRIEELQTKARRNVDVNIDLNNAINDLNRLEGEMKNLQELNSIKGAFANMESSLKDAFGTEYVEKLRNEIEQLESSVLNLDGAFDRSANSARNMLSTASSNMARFNSQVDRSSRFMNDFAGSFGAYTLGNIAGDGIIRTINGIVDSYKDLDDAMTNIKKVADGNDINSIDKLDNIRNVAIQTSKEVGKSSADVMNAIADTVQSGIGSMEVSMDVAKQTMMFANVGDIEQSVASSAVNTMIKGFDIDAVNKFNRGLNGTINEVTQLENAMDMLNMAS